MGVSEAPKCDHDELWGMTDQPTTCPKCGSRTSFDDIKTPAYKGADKDWHQHHKCLNPKCGFEFVVEDG